MAGVKYVKEFQFGGKVANTSAPKKYASGGKVCSTGAANRYADGGKVKSGLSYVEQAPTAEKQAILDGIAKGSQGKPGMLSRAATAVKNKAIEKSPATMRMIGITRDDEGEGYARGGPVTKHQKLATGQDIGYARGGMAMRKSGLPAAKQGPMDPMIKPFKKPSRRGKA